ncbi:MAG: polysaccharide biosynthesis/export family protein [Flavobacteriaceae bacterium]
MLYINIKATNPELVDIFNGGAEANNNMNNINSENLYYSGYSVDTHGMINLPVVGEMNVLGYTTDQVRERLYDSLNKYFKADSELFIEVKLAGIKYTIVGEVGSTGTKVVNQNQLNIIEAIANSGDITVVGDRRAVEVFRLEDDVLKKYTIDLTDISTFDSNSFQIYPNDIISVPPLKQKSWGTGTNGVQTFTTLISVFSLLTSTYLLAKSL